MSFPDRLVKLRKARGLSQRGLASHAGVHLTQVQRYESGASQPTLEVIRKMAVALHVSADTLVFDEGERGPQDNELKMLLEAADQFTPQEKTVAVELMRSLVERYGKIAKGEDS